MVKAVIFDMDGVIIDSEPLHLSIEEDIFKKLGISITYEEHNTFIGTTSHYMWNKIKTNHNLTESLEELVELDRNTYLDFLNNTLDLQPIKGVKELIINLHKNNIKLAVASSSPLNVIEKILSLFEIRGYFDYIVTGDCVSKSKPEPDIFLYAAKKLDADPKECVVIEDSHNGVLAAKKANMKCIGYKNVNSGNQDLSKADITIDDFNDINAAFINGLNN
ncbi:MAG: HAD family phosphatase [Clostridium lundense]|nr:HAD family phosphatase [Clostridium lundense]